ncbi:MAG TPA: hypothetical protein VK661_10465 [Planctomycetota bacterium]|nr:hypothetical protein [Planctomycetota bacterium]
MNPRTCLIVVALLASLLLLQHGLERTEVQALERASLDLGELRASSLLPTYIGSLFLGSFRAVAIDVLWIQMQRMREQEHRYFETIEIMDLITKLQPRNPEAWAYLGWDAAYNIANQYRTAEEEEARRKLERPGVDRERAKSLIADLDARIAEKDAQFRKWIRLGLEKLAEGSRHLPDDPYLKQQIGLTFLTKASYTGGHMDRQFLRAVEDPSSGLQAIAMEPPEPGRVRSAYELGDHWFARALEALEKQIRKGKFHVYRSLAESLRRAGEKDGQYHTTQMGLNIDPTGLEGFRFVCRYLHAVHLWYSARETEERGEGERSRALLREASAAFQRASDKARETRSAYATPSWPMLIFSDREQLCRGLAEACAEQAGLPLPLSEADRARLLARLAKVRLPAQDLRVRPVDDDYVLNYLGWLKQSLGGDAYEYNDDFYTEAYLEIGRRTEATIGPELSDIDWFKFMAEPPPRPGPSRDDEETSGPFTAGFQVTRIGGLTLFVTAYAYRGGDLAAVESFQVTDGKPREFNVVVERPGPVFILVTGSASSPETGRVYWIQALGVRR